MAEPSLSQHIYRLVEKSPAFFKLERSLPLSQEPVPVHSHVNPAHVPSSQTHFIISPSTPGSAKWPLPLRATCLAHILLDFINRMFVRGAHTIKLIMYAPHPYLPRPC
jgi:hypothetical protein